MVQNTPPLPSQRNYGPTYARLWLLGFLDAMKGEAVNGDDQILSGMAEPLVVVAEQSIDSAASIIAATVQENPCRPSIGPSTKWATTSVPL